ncbi:MAG TPA: hypothetical protein VFJ16_19340 [Longimicrobium sp.]|nr:hypothetical protein [Longimicrobium sp.]
MASITLAGTYVSQGNANGRTLNTAVANTVLKTDGLVGCVAVCGYSGNTAFMIHSDSTGAGGIGKTDLITGIRHLVPAISDGQGFTISLFGGSVPGTRTYLQGAEKLPRATFVNGGESDSAYLTWNGIAAALKSGLKGPLGVGEGETLTIT